MSKKIDEFIKVIQVSDRVLVVKMGVDAVAAIATQKGIVVIDAGISHSLTAKYRNVIARELKRNDFAFLINTHAHPDHIGGNQVFSDVVIIGHENCLSEISKNWQNPEKRKSNLLKIVDNYDNELYKLIPDSDEWNRVFCQKIRYQQAYNDLSDHVITKPVVTFNERLNIFMGNAALNLTYFGKAHSESDIIIHIPELKLLMTGDLFSPGGNPSIGDVDKQDVAQWKSVMQEIMVRRNEIVKVIGGHGQIMSIKDLDSFDKYIEKKWEGLLKSSLND
jgi:cyclase